MGGEIGSKHKKGKIRRMGILLLRHAKNMKRGQNNTRRCNVLKQRKKAPEGTYIEGANDYEPKPGNKVRKELGK